MTQHPEIFYIQRCLASIEKKLGWGPREAWSNQDYEKLGEIIFEETAVRVSSTTLKRVWGRVKYESSPTTATLNTLAQFAGHDNWRVFVQTASGPSPVTLPDRSESKNGTSSGSSRRKSYLLLLVLTLVVVGLISLSGYISYTTIFHDKTAVDTTKFSFKANKIASEGVPNSVVFTYDARAAKTDSVFIVQTWDIRRKKLVPKNGTNHSAIYYYPGYFEAKLIVDGKVVREHELQISSNGWLGLAEGDDKPFYFNQKDIVQPGKIEISNQLLVNNNFSLKPSLPKIRLYNQGDFGDLMNDNFTFETQVKNDTKEGNNLCQFFEILIHCKGAIIIIPLSARECVGEIQLNAAGNILDSKLSDLSGFGADLRQWTGLKVEVKDKMMTCFVNGKTAKSIAFPNEPKGIVGVQYRFNGVGAVKETRFVSKNKIYQL